MKNKTHNKIICFIDKNLEIINASLEEAKLMYMIEGTEWWSSRGVALLLEIGRNTMLKELRKLKILKEDNTPTGWFTANHRGFFHVKQGRYNKKSTYYSRECIDFLREELAHLPKKERNEYKPQQLTYADKFFIDGLVELLDK